MKQIIDRKKYDTETAEEHFDLVYFEELFGEVEE